MTPILSIVILLDPEDNSVHVATDIGDCGANELANAIGSARLALREVTAQVDASLDMHGKFGMAVQHVFMKGLTDGSTEMHSAITTKENKQ